MPACSHTAAFCLSSFLRMPPAHGVFSSALIYGACFFIDRLMLFPRDDRGPGLSLVRICSIQFTMRLSVIRRRRLHLIEPYVQSPAKKSKFQPASIARFRHKTTRALFYPCLPTSPRRACSAPIFRSTRPSWSAASGGWLRNPPIKRCSHVFHCPVLEFFAFTARSQLSRSEHDLPSLMPTHLRTCCNFPCPCQYFIMDDGRGSNVTVFKWNMDAETWMPTTDYAEVIGQACDSPGFSSYSNMRAALHSLSIALPF